MGSTHGVRSHILYLFVLICTDFEGILMKRLQSMQHMRESSNQIITSFGHSNQIITSFGDSVAAAAGPKSLRLETDATRDVLLDGGWPAMR